MIFCPIRTLPNRSVLVLIILVKCLWILVLLNNTQIMILWLIIPLSQRLPSRSGSWGSIRILLWLQLLWSWFDIILVFELVYFPRRNGIRLRPSFWSFINELGLNINWDILRLMLVFLEFYHRILLILVLVLYRRLWVRLRSLLERSCACHLLSSQILIILLKSVLVLRIVVLQIILIRKLHHLVFVAKTLLLDQSFVLELIHELHVVLPGLRNFLLGKLWFTLIFSLNYGGSCFDAESSLIFLQILKHLLMISGNFKVICNLRLADGRSHRVPYSFHWFISE